MYVNGFCCVKAADGQWSQLKETYEVRIQELFDQIEPHWRTMEIDADYQEAFFDINRGSGAPTIAAVSLYS